MQHFLQVFPSTPTIQVTLAVSLAAKVVFSSCATVQLLLGSVSAWGVAGISNVAGISCVHLLVQRLCCCGAFFFCVTIPSFSHYFIFS
jgi:hypothetical protein